MWTTLGIIVLALVAIALILIGVSVNHGSDSGGPGIIAAGVGLTVVAVIWLVIACFNRVPANSIGIATSFGKAKGDTLASGGHWLPPWYDVTVWSTRVQTIHRDGQGECISVRFKGGGTGCVDATIRTKVNGAHVTDLWRKYQTLDNAKNQLVRSDANNAFLFVYGEYEPELAIDGTKQQEIAQSITERLSTALAPDGLEVDSIAVSHVNLDPAVQGRINNLIQAQARTRVAEQDKLTALQEQAANKTAQVALTPQTLINKCLDITDEATRQGKQLPATWNCFGSPTGALVGVK